jgi:glycosidase
MKHPEFYKKDAKGNVISPVSDWADVAGLNYTNAELRTYMIEMLKYWLREFDLDGFRCDVAGDVPTDFWESARAELTKIKPDIVMIAEASKPELLLKAFELDYAWPFHTTLTNVFEFGAPATALIDTWKSDRTRHPKGALEMRFSDNHDEKRAVVRFGERGALAASALVFTMDGVPMLYNGMEVGDTSESGAPALFENLQVFWPIAERRRNFFRSTKPSSLCAKHIQRSSRATPNGSPMPTLHAS